MLLAYTTERTEKEALKIYLARYGTLQEAITRIEEDRKADGGLLYLEFARKVNQHQKLCHYGKNSIKNHIGYNGFCICLY
mgnify:CR=1 FL=1